MYKRWNAENAVFRGQTGELAAVFAHFGVARR